jgi:DNA polymerase III subunit epsilon
MAKLLLLDLESTGLDTERDRITEYCAAAFDTTTGELVSNQGYLWDETYPELSEDIQALTRITPELLRREGKKPFLMLDRIVQTALQLDAVVAYNAHLFDKPLFEAECRRNEVSLPTLKWVDALADIAYPPQMRCRKLSHLALDHGIPVDPAKLHGAATDVELMLAIVQRYDMDAVLKLVESPLIVAKAWVSFADKELAKQRGYSWKPEIKSWIKTIRESQWETEKKACPFDISRLNTTS